MAMGEYPHIRVAGSASQRGRQYGEQARERVHRSVSAYREVFAELAGWDWQTGRPEASRFEAPIAAYGPKYLADMRGIGEAPGHHLADVLALNLLTHAIFPPHTHPAPPPP